ncbi:hypothetical protein ACFL1M_04960 [Patescibacteria group bacterium]
MKLKLILVSAAILFLSASPIRADDVADTVCAPVSGSEHGQCVTCVSGGGAWTGLGCIAADADEFVVALLKFAVGAGGGIAFLMLIYGAFLYTTSAGDPKALENAKGTIGSSITGLMLIIFSVVILNMIGFELLQLPGF